MPSSRFRLKSIAVLLTIYLSFVECVIKPISFKNGGYESITITIDEDLPEDPELIDKLKEILKESSKILWAVTKNQSYFREFDIIIPSNWSNKPDYSEIIGFCVDESPIRVENRGVNDEPSTEQPGECGEPGKFMYLPTNFIKDDTIENKDKIFVHEWAHLRYGVFEEHGIKGDPNYPYFTIDKQNGHEVIPSVCTKTFGDFVPPNGETACEMNSLTQQIDPLCEFIAFNGLRASLMFKPIQDTMDGFCSDDMNDVDYLHNKNAHTKQNVKCNGKSVLSVILNHVDFKNQISNLTPESIEPKINFKKISDENPDVINIFLYDVSSSMAGMKINVLSLASKQLINNSLTDGVKLGLAQFYTYAEELHPIVNFNSTTKQTLYNAVPTNHLYGTSIGAGLQIALEMINKYSRYTLANIVLISDGEETRYPYINDVLPLILANKKIKIITFAFGRGAAERLEQLANSTGGYGLSFVLDNVQDQITESTNVQRALLDVLLKNCQKDIKQVIVSSDSLVMAEKANSTSSNVRIDSDIGKNTIFSVATKDLLKVNISLHDPNKKVYISGSPEYEESESSVIIIIPQSIPGNWFINIEKLSGFENNQIKVETLVTSELSPYSKIGLQNSPVLLSAEISHSEVDANVNPPKIYANLKKGYDSVLEANVIARVERPDGSVIAIDLRDDGLGCDANKNDGIYSTYFVNYTENGRYNVLVSAVNDGNALLGSRMARNYYNRNVKKHLKTKSANKTFSIQDFKQVLHFSNTVQNTNRIPAFSRVQNAGAFRLVSYSNIDKIPPIRVTDFSFSSIDENSKTIELIWTSAGDDLSVGTAKLIQIRADLNLSQIEDDISFDSLYLFNQNDVIQGSLNPLSGGQKHLLKLSLNNFWSDQKFTLHFAMKTIDNNNNTSPKSNIISAHFGVLEKLNILYEEMKTFKQQTFSDRFDVNIQNSTTNGTFIFKLNELNDLQDLNIFFREPNGKTITENCKCYTRDYKNGQIVLIHETDLFGKWTVTIQRANLLNPKDVNFSIKAIGNI